MRAAVRGNAHVGWSLTALAICVGAPFWFDAIGKLASLRTAVKPPKNRRRSRRHRNRPDLPQPRVAAICASLATVLRLRAVPVFAAGITSFDDAMPSP